MTVGVATPKFCYPSVPYPPSGPADLAQSRMDRDLPPLPGPLGWPRRVSFAAQPELHEDESERRRAERALRRQSRQQRDLEIVEREQRLERLAQQLLPSRSECRRAELRRSSDTRRDDRLLDARTPHPSPFVRPRSTSGPSSQAIEHTGHEKPKPYRQPDVYRRTTSSSAARRDDGRRSSTPTQRTEAADYREDDGYYSPTPSRSYSERPPPAYRPVPAMPPSPANINSTSHSAALATRQHASTFHSLPAVSSAGSTRTSPYAGSSQPRYPQGPPRHEPAISHRAGITRPPQEETRCDTEDRSRVRSRRRVSEPVSSPSARIIAGSSSQQSPPGRASLVAADEHSPAELQVSSSSLKVARRAPSPSPLPSPVERPAPQRAVSTPVEKVIRDEGRDVRASLHMTLDEMEEDVTCSICMQVIVAAHGMSPCGHTICGGCANEWIREHSTCPACRAELTRDAPFVPLLGMDAIISKWVRKQGPDWEGLEDWKERCEMWQAHRAFNEQPASNAPATHEVFEDDPYRNWIHQDFGSLSFDPLPRTMDTGSFVDRHDRAMFDMLTGSPPSVVQTREILFPSSFAVDAVRSLIQEGVRDRLVDRLRALRL